MRAAEIVNRRQVIASDAFVEVVVWRLFSPVPPSVHQFKYRLAYVVAGRCVLRYDNERGKGDHRHLGETEAPYSFVSFETLLRDFSKDVERWNHENGRA